MTVVTGEITVQTRGDCDIVDITSQMAKKVLESGMNSGTATLFVSGSTAGVTTVEYEPRLLDDTRTAWDRVVPKDIAYEHNKTWGDGNGHSHVRASMLGASLTVPFVGRKLTLGTWQQIVLIDFDNRPRLRKLVLQVLGE